MDSKKSNSTKAGTEPTTNSSNKTSEEVTERSPKSSSIAVETDDAESSSEGGAKLESTEQSKVKKSSENQGGEDRSEPGESTESSSSGTDSPNGKSTDDYGVPNTNEISAKQLEVLRAISHRPHATQAELANELDVSRATISQRVNAIDGFEWADRLEFVNTVFNESEQGTDTSNEFTPTEEIADRLDTIEDRVETIAAAFNVDSEPQPSTFDNPELVTTVIRACVDSEYVTEEQEEQIIFNLIKNE
jgi:transcriptional regulator with XRE-family HTH domain